MFALASGTLWKTPISKTAKSGVSYCTATLRTSGTEGVFVSMVAFGGAAEELGRLREGEAVSCQGLLKIGVYQARDGEHKPSIELTAHVVTALRQPAKKRERKEPAPAPAGNREPVYDDAIPF